MKKVRDILANKPPGVITITPHDSLQQGCQVLAEHNIGALVAVDSAEKPVGIVSERDIVRRLSEHGPAALEHTISDVMTTDLIVAAPDDDLNSISNTMTNNRIRHLPILDSDALVGIVSIGDVVKTQLSEAKDQAQALERYITGGHA